MFYFQGRLCQARFKCISKMAATIRRMNICRRSLAVQHNRHSSIALPEPVPSSSNDENWLYPPIKPKYPPGRWGGMEPRYAWIWQKSIEESQAINDVRDRTASLCNKTMRQLVLNIKDLRPRTLDFKKYMTKTHLISGLPKVYGSLNSSQLDILTQKLAPLVCDLIVMEKEQLQKQRLLRKVKHFDNDMERLWAQNLLSSLLTSLLTHLSSDFPHLLTAQYDENVSISALWSRHGIKRSYKKILKTDEYEWVTVNDQRVSAESSLDIILRSEQPLPEFVDRESTQSLSNEVPELKFHPQEFGGQFDSHAKCSVEAGHVWGDPCEYGLMSVLNSEWTRYVAKKYTAKYAAEARLSQAIASSFLWLAAQAHNQGFNTLIDMTYPLTTQTVLSDGQHWQFLAYQLNTLQLWKDNAGNSYCNLCWASEEAELFSTVEEGKVHGFNPDVLRQLISFLCLAPVQRPYDMKPTLPASAARPELKEEFVPLKKEKVVIKEEEKYVL